MREYCMLPKSGIICTGRSLWNDTVMWAHIVFSYVPVKWCHLYRITILSTVDYTALRNDHHPCFVRSGHPVPEAFIKEWLSSAKEEACDWVRRARHDRRWNAFGKDDELWKSENFIGVELSYFSFKKITKRYGDFPPLVRVIALMLTAPSKSLCCVSLAKTFLVSDTTRKNPSKWYVS